MDRRSFIDAIFYLSLSVGAQPGQAAPGEKPSFTDAFVTVSTNNPHYFELTGGDPFIVNGPCLAWASDRATMESYFKKLAASGGNFARVWLCHWPFEVEEKYGEYDETNARKIDELLAWAVQYKIKIKLCLENTRQIVADTTAPFNKPQYHIDHGGPFRNIDEYINTAEGRNAYLNRLTFFSRRYGCHPAIFGWELWNEMNGIMCKGLHEWNDYMLPRVHTLFPENLVLQSLGSFDSNSRRNDYQYINRLPANEVGQIHRYIDEGAQLETCSAPMDMLTSDAIDELRSYHINKPLLLAEVGAVLPRHSGPSPLYPVDKEGILLHDMLFAPFFSGAAGTGNSWHWDVYIDKNDLWYHYGRFKEAIKGINPIAERFVPVKMHQDGLRIYALAGTDTILAWCRDAGNDWKSELQQRITPATIRQTTIDFSSLVHNTPVKTVSCYDPWQDHWQEATPAPRIALPDFKRSIIVKIYLIPQNKRPG